MNGPRVLHILDHSLPLVSGYSVRSHGLLRAQRILGIDAIALTSPKHGAPADSATIDGVEYIRLPPANGERRVPPPLGEARMMARLALRLGSELRRGRFDFLHAHSPILNGLPALWTARRHRLPLVYEIRAPWEDAASDRGTQTIPSLRYRTTRLLESSLMSRADAVVVISRGLLDDAVRRGVPPSRLFHVPNGVDTAAFRPAPADEALVQRHRLAGGVVFGFIGSIVRYEGLDVLLRAFAQGIAREPHARLILVGDGEEGVSLRRLAEDLGIAERTLFTGPVPHAQVRRWYSVCDVLVYPRRRSRLTELVTPLKPLEAMAMGKIVVASDVGGLRELICDGRTGRLCPPGEPEALAGVLADVTSRPTDHAALGEAARRWVSAERDWLHVARTYADVYAQTSLAAARRIGDRAAAPAASGGG
jgi:PEP-CTERM/exosortase A-associated glycosyltransferase